MQLLKENEGLKKKTKNFGFNKISSDDNLVKFFTGLPSRDTFLWVSSLVKDKARSYHSSKSVNDHVLMVFMKLRLGLLNKDLALRFQVPDSTVSKIVRSWLPALAKHMKNLIIWPDRATIRQSHSKRNSETVFV